jgi:hypothetical protein
MHKHFALKTSGKETNQETEEYMREIGGGQKNLSGS